MSIAPNQLDYQLAEVKKKYLASTDPAEKERLHQQGEALRQSGASEAVANLLATGSTSGTSLADAQSYMGQDYTPDADLAQRLSAALSNGTAQTTTTATPTVTASAPQTADLSSLYKAIRPQTANLPAYQQQTPSYTDVSQLYGAGPTKPITMPQLTTVQAPQTDLSAIRQRAEQVPEMKLPTYQQQTPAQVDLTPLKAAGPTTPITAPAYQPPSTEGLRTGIAGMTSITTPTATTGQTFIPEDLQKAIAAQSQGQAPAPMQAQFGTPEQFGQYVAQTQQMLQPYTDAQKAAATAAFNQAMQKLGNQWAGRGMLASGAAAGAQQQAAQGFGVQMGLLEGQQLEQAINAALQAGQLSTAEAQAIWNQAMTGTQFGQQQAVTQAQLLQQALSQQEQQRLSEQNLGLNVQQARTAQEQAQIAALQSALGLETQQGQFGAELGLQTQQLEMQRQQSLADNLARTMGMDIAQQQWGQEFNRAQLNDIFSQAVTSQQLNEQQRQAALNALMQLAQMDIQQGQFGAQLGVQQQQFGAEMNLQTQQLEMQRLQGLADNMARTLGLEIAQRQWGQEFTAQQMRDIFSQALSSAQLDQNERQTAQSAMLSLAQLEQQQAQWGAEFPLQQAGVTGTYQGQPTLQAQQLQASLQQQKWDQAMDEWQAQMKMEDAEFDKWLKQQQLTISQANSASERDYRGWLKSKGLTEQQGDVVTNARIGDLMDATNVPDIETAYRYLTVHGEEMANEGVDMSKLLSAIARRFNVGTTGTEVLDALTEAFNKR